MKRILSTMFAFGRVIKEKQDMKKGTFVAMIAVAGMTSAVSAQFDLRVAAQPLSETSEVFLDGFERYPLGALNAGGWDGSAGARGVVTDAFSFTGTKSIEISGGADAVHPFAGIRSGVHTVTAQMLLFANDHTTDTFFIVNNEYNHGGPYTWTIEIQFDAATGTVLDDFRPHTPILIAYDRWAEIRIVFDLDNDVQTTFYDGTMLSTGTMTREAGDPLEIANIDLFTLGARCFYDDITVEAGPCDPCDMNCDGVVDAFDIEPFIELLFGGATPCSPCAGDTNGDGTVNAEDIEPFFNCMFP